MFKKTPIFIIIAIILIVFAGGFYFYKNQKQAPAEEGIEINTQELLGNFEVKNEHLTPEMIQVYQQRFDHLKSLLEQNSDNFAAWLDLGIVKKGVGDYEGARDIWLYSATMRPDSSSPLGNLGDLYANFLNEPVKGEEYYKKALVKDPNDVNYYLGLADVYRYRIPEKESLYEQTLLEGLNKIPDDTTLIAFLAVYYAENDQTDKAIEYYEKLIEVSPDNVAAKEELEKLRNNQ